MRQYTVGRDDAGRRADRFLSKAAPDIPASLLQKTFRQKDVKCGGKRIPPAYLLSEGEELLVYFPEKPAAPAPDPWLCYEQGSCAPLCAVYEDEELLVAHKPAGLASQGDDGTREVSLELYFRRRLCQEGIWKPRQGNGFLPSLCHRLDKATEGLVLCAKNAEALRLWTEAIRLRGVKKNYKALVRGKPVPPQGDWRDFLHKDTASGFVTVRKDRSGGAKSASLSYRAEGSYPLRNGGEASLLDICLHTGRTHQIRVQCASRGHPVLGDTRYGDPAGHGQAPGRIALCAYRLELTGGDILSVRRGQVFAIAPDFSDFIR